MRIPALLLAALLLPACAGPSPSSAPAPGVPLFDGKPLEHWLAEMRDLHPERRSAACGAVKTFGDRALPGVIEICASEFPRVRISALETLAWFTYDRPPRPELVAVLLAAMADPDEEVRVEAADGLHYQSPLSPEVRAALEGMRDGDPSPWARKKAAEFLADAAKWAEERAAAEGK